MCLQGNLTSESIQTFWCCPFPLRHKKARCWGSGYRSEPRRSSASRRAAAKTFCPRPPFPWCQRCSPHPEDGTSTDDIVLICIMCSNIATEAPRHHSLCQCSVWCGLRWSGAAASGKSPWTTWPGWPSAPAPWRPGRDSASRYWTARRRRPESDGLPANGKRFKRVAVWNGNPMSWVIRRGVLTLLRISSVSDWSSALSCILERWACSSRLVFTWGSLNFGLFSLWGTFCAS